jgi:hypothetical protein
MLAPITKKTKKPISSSALRHQIYLEAVQWGKILIIMTFIVKVILASKLRISLFRELFLVKSLKARSKIRQTLKALIYKSKNLKTNTVN